MPRGQQPPTHGHKVGLSPQQCKNLPRKREGTIPDWEVEHFHSFSQAMQKGWRTSPKVRPHTGPLGFQPPQHTMTLWGSGQSIPAKPAAPTAAVPRCHYSLLIRCAGLAQDHTSAWARSSSSSAGAVPHCPSSGATTGPGTQEELGFHHPTWCRKMLSIVVRSKHLPSMVMPQ